MRPRFWQMSFLIALGVAVWSMLTFTSSAAPPTVKTLTATVTTATDFEVDRVFDLGRVAPFYISTTVLSLNPDGETVGDGSGQISVDTASFQVSRDGATWVSVQTSEWFTDAPYDGSQSLPYLSNDTRGVTARYVRVHQFHVVDGFTLDTYAGTHHPVASARIDVEYL